MNHRTRTSTSFRLHGPGALVLIALFLGCGGGSSGGGKAEPEIECEAPLLAVSEGQPLDEIALEGIPEGFGPLLAARVLAEETSSLTVITREEDGSILLAAPIHPTGSVEGGEVTLEIFDSTGRSCPPIPFTILALPPAPGAAEDMLVQLEALLHGQATYFETTVAALRDMSVDEVTEEHRSLYMAQYSLNESENPNSLRALLDGTAPVLEGVEIDLDLTDRLLAKVGFPAMLREMVEEMETLLDEDPLRGQEVRAIQSQQAGLEGIQNAYQLHVEMEMAQWGDSYQREGALKRTVGGMATAAGGVGLIPLPQAKLASTVVGGGLFAFLKATEAAAKLLPSSFVSIDFELTKPEFSDDDPSTGEWQKVEVVATSLGMSLDQAALELILELAKLKDGLGEWYAEFVPEEVKDVILKVILDVAVAEAINTTGQGEGFLYIPPKRTKAIDITEEPWSFAEIHGSLIPVGRQGYRLNGTWEGDLSGAVRIGTALGMFGGQHIFATEDVPINPIRIEATPSFAMVELEEEVEFTVVVAGAYDPSITVVTESGHTTHLPQPDGSHLLRYTAPLADALLPTRIILESDASTGMYIDPAYPRATTTIHISAKGGLILIEPTEVCLDSGEQLTFTATVIGMENTKVRWEATAGSINSTGRYTAPSGRASVEITAISEANEDVQASVTIQVGSCDCYSTSTLSGPGSGHHVSDTTWIGLDRDDTPLSLEFGEAGDGSLGLIFMDGTFPDAPGTYPALVEADYPGIGFGHSLRVLKGDEVFVEIAHFEKGSRIVDGERVDTYRIEGTMTGSATFSVLDGENVMGRDPPLVGSIQLVFRALYDLPLPGLSMINCSGGFR